MRSSCRWVALRTSFIDVRDIAAVAAVALTEPGHQRQAYDLTGSEAFELLAGRRD